MSHRCYTDVVPFVAQFGETKTGLNIQTLLCSPEEFNYYIKENEEQTFDLCGWTILKEEDTRIGKHSSIPATKWVKKNKVVYCFNCSPYNNVGEMYALVVANDRKSIKAFVDDFKDVAEFSDIGKNEAVEWSA